MSDKILKFSAEWCQPCKTLAKTMASLDLGVPVEEIDIDQNDQLTAEYKIRGVPTLILIRDGKEVARTSGTKTADQLKQFAAG